MIPMATREGDREMKVFEWKEELKSYWKDSHKKQQLGFFSKWHEKFFVCLP